MKDEAKKSFQEYLAQLIDLKEQFEKKEYTMLISNGLDGEIKWTRQMIFKVANL